MARSIEHLIQPTPNGVKIDLKRLYVYEDGHANLWTLAASVAALTLASYTTLTPSG